MEAYKTVTTLATDGALMLSNLPFRAGDRVEVIVLGTLPSAAKPDRYPLRGMAIHYERPTEPVAEEDWEALR
jgi:hypothetical protein